MAKYRLIVDLPTDRIVWFTTDLETALYTDKQSVQAEYEGELPEGMTVLNAWNYRLRNQRIEAPNPTAAQRVPLVEQNRTSIREFVQSKFNGLINARINQTPAQRLIEAEASQYVIGTSSPWLDFVARRDKLPNALAAALAVTAKRDADHEWLMQVETARTAMLERVEAAESSAELFSVRADVFSKVNELS